MKKSSVDSVLALEAKMIVAMAFRNGPIEALHTGKPCPTCSVDSTYSRISDDEMKGILKAAVNSVYSLLWKKDTVRLMPSPLSWERDTSSIGTTPNDNHSSHSLILTGR
jgi:hypothetical protein